MKPQFEQKENGLLVRAPAKINLSLLIAGKREDGFHEIETIMSKINLYDELFFQIGVGDGIELVCDGKYAAPCDESNLVYKACKMAIEAAGSEGDKLLSDGLRITLTKNIPIGAGLGGGSSDAASTLMGVNELGQLGLSDAQMYGFASELGSDIPFFLMGPLGYCTGRGEEIFPIDEIFNYKAILVFSDVNVSTKDVYVNYSHDKVLYESLSNKIKVCREEKRVDFIAKMCANMLESSCFALNDRLREIKSRIEKLGIGNVCLSGSGSAMYVLITGADSNNLERYQTMLNECVGCDTIVVDNNEW